MSNDDVKKLRTGRPSIDSEAITVRMTREQIEALDDWRRVQSDLPGRPEAIRRLIALGLVAVVNKVDVKPE
jgi:hypothetical protein